MEDSELMKVCAVGGNAVSAFLSWRLQATNACDVTLVWKSGFESVFQYGISFKSSSFGNERFKPRRVVRTPEDAAQNKEGAFDYVILCIKALPDVYDLASVIDAVVTPQHTCILVNTTHTLGVEAAIEERFPTNVVLSLVSNAELNQLGSSEFEHSGSTEVWVGPANKNGDIPVTIQEDMAQALAMTLSTGRVDCKVSPNIKQQQFERVIGPIAFHPASVIFETPSHSALLEKTGVRQLISDVIDELIQLATAQGCALDAKFKENTIKEQCEPSDSASIMWQDYIARRPMEVETFLGSPIKLAQSSGIKLPRIETLYAIFHNLNIVNQSRPKEMNGLPAPSGSPTGAPPMPRMSSVPPPRQMNGHPNGNGAPMPRPRPRNSSNFSGPPPSMRRQPPPMNGGPPNGYRPPMNGGPNGHGPSRQPSRRGSFDENDLGEFSHLVVYEDSADADGGFNADTPDIALRERELQLRQRELALKEQEMRMRRGGPPPPPSVAGGRRRAPPVRNMNGGVYDDDDEEDDYFDPNSGPGQITPVIDPDNFDMMSVTSRKNRSKPPPSQTELRMNPEGPGGGMGPRGGGRWRPGFGRNRSSQIINATPGIHDNILDDPLMSFTSNRYGNVDRGQMNVGSRANSLTASHLHELQTVPGGMSGPYPRRSSQSPGNPYSPSIRGVNVNGRPSPPNGFGGPGPNGRPSPPDGVRQPVPRYPPGQGNTVAPQQVEQRVGVSSLQPPNAKTTRSLTGSASASAESGESTHLGSEPSAHSSQSSLGPRPPIGVR
ncbi:ApbA-domain-containing protein [Hypoxylon rubiginosum]|uniref:ApbA-domain-containing protein n=1 Tax=Hypoxylon rubiginosum TaxID=110542 RepID=A0ACC0CTE7_9PEZI|nr:ApbA-domain-containing protein [Hypoxylon rubiginosum]